MDEERIDFSKGLTTIENGMVKFREFKKAKSCSLNEFITLQTERKKATFKTPLLPNGCIMYRQKETDLAIYCYYYIHLPMGAYKLRTDRKVYKIILPQIVIAITMNELTQIEAMIGACYKEDIDLKNKCWVTPKLQNIWNDGRLCMGTVPGATTQRGYVNNFMDSFFSNSFNSDLIGNNDFEFEAISADQEQMVADGHSMLEASKRLFRRYDRETKVLLDATENEEVNDPGYDGRTFNRYFGIENDA